MAEEVLSLVAKVSLDDNNFKNGLRNVQSQARNLADNVKNVFSGVGNTIKNIGSTMSGWGKTVSVGITAPITALGTMTAKTSIDFLKLKENTRTAFKVLLGNAEDAEKMLKDLHLFAKTTPFSYSTYLQAGKQLVAMGVSAKDAIPYLEGITNAAIATGAGQEGITTLSEAIGRMSSKGKIQLEELNRMIEMGVPAVKILGNAYGVTEEEIYKTMSSGKLWADEALPKLLDGMNKGTNGVNGMTAAYGGLATEMKGTLAGALDSLRSKFRDTSVELWNSEEAYPVLQKIIRSFTKTLEILPKVFVGLTRVVVPVLTTVNEKLQSFGEYLESADPGKLEAIGKVILGLAAAGPILVIVGKLTSALGGLFSAIGTIAGALPAIGSMLSAVASVGFAPILIAVGAVIGIFVFLRQEWDRVVAVFTGWAEKTGILRSFQNLKEQAQNVWEKLGGLRDLFYIIGGVLAASLIPAVAVLMGVFTALIKTLDGVMKMVGGVTDVLAGVGQILLGVFTLDGEKILGGFRTLWDGIKGIFLGAVQGIWSLVSGYFQGVWSFISSLLESIGITQWLSNTRGNISKWFSEVLAGVHQWGNNLWGNVQNFFGRVGQAVTAGFVMLGSAISSSAQSLTTPFMLIWENCKKYVLDAFNAIKSFLVNIWGSITSSISSYANNIYSTLQSVFNSVRNVVTGVFNSILSSATSVWNNVKNAVSSAVNSVLNVIQSQFNNIKNAVSNAWNSVKSTTANVWNNIKNSMTQPMQNAFSAVKSLIDRMKGLFNFSWSLPKLKLPHFKISGSFNLNPPSVPSFGIDWYKEGAILNRPTIFGLNPFSNNLMVGGEAGAEAIAPIDTLQDYVRQAVSKNESSDTLRSLMTGIFELLNEYLPTISKQKLVLDTGVIVGELAPSIDYSLGNINALKVRGN